MTGTFMAAEIAETGAALRRQLDANRETTARLAAELRAGEPAFVATIARGSSDHAAAFLKHAVELKLGLACASLAPSIASLYRAPLRLRARRRDHHLAVGPQPRHRRHAARGQDRRRDDDRARQRRGFARGGGRRRLSAAARGRGTLGRRDQVDDRLDGRRRRARRALERRRRSRRRDRDAAGDPRRRPRHRAGGDRGDVGDAKIRCSSSAAARPSRSRWRRR